MGNSKHGGHRLGGQLPDYLKDRNYTDIRKEWDGVEYLLRFHEGDTKWHYYEFVDELRGTVVPNLVCDVLWRYAQKAYKDLMFVDADRDETKQQIRDEAVKGRSVRDGVRDVGRFATLCQSALTLAKWQGIPCMQPIKTVDLQDCLTLWSKSARETSVRHIAQYGKRTAASGAPPGGTTIDISSSDMKDGQYGTLFTLGHELGHKADLAVRAQHFDVIQAIYPSYTKLDPTKKEWGQTKALQSLEFFADCFSALWMRYGLNVRKEDVWAGAESCLWNTPCDRIHPAGDERLKEVSKHLP
jgi:hypothetical protein